MGLGDAVSQILAKDVAAPDPVLAKRKTALMKELEVDQKQEQKKKKRAVVALFNAVAKHQHPDDFQDR